jgi:putative heme-binding domain-containing protein
MGGTFYQGSFFVTAPPDLIRFTDTNGDGAADKREVILSGWTLNHNAATLSGPFLGPDGWLYMCDARRGFDINTKEGKTLKGKSARIWRCRPDGSGLESVSGGGFDNTIELIFMPSGETIGTMTYFTEPMDGQRDALMHWVEGGVYPKPFPVIEKDALILTGELMPVMTKLARVSPAGLMRYRGSVFGNDFDGNLFSAQFNTGRIMRHKVSSAGATFRTEDEPFLTSENLDTHPTDVLQDADGSLLVVNTGGWFIAGCPLSVVAKPDIRGGIFRIRKRNASVIDDPWGKKLHIKEMTVKELSALLLDARPAVVDNALQQMINLGEPSVEALKKVLRASNDESLRATVVFALYRIGNSHAMDAVVTALKDKSEIVRTAAARAVGLAKEIKAVGVLQDIVRNNRGSLQRQAATALGQIGDVRAVTSLLEASATADDRFVEHAIIYALITLQQKEPLLAALHHTSPNVKKSALIALDQIDPSAVKKNHLLPFLESKNETLERTGIWVAVRHQEWGDLMVKFLQSKSINPQLSATDKKLVTDVVISFCGNRDVQQFLISRLQGRSLPEASKLFVLDLMGKCPLKEFPDAWTKILVNLLESKNDTLRSSVLDLVQARPLPALARQLNSLIQDSGTEPVLRLKALNARISSSPQLSQDEFNLVIGYLGAKTETVNQFAVRLLHKAALSDAQLLTLAEKQIPVSDALSLPVLVKAFEGNKNEHVGSALATSLMKANDRLDFLLLEEIEDLFETFPPPVQKTATPLIERLRERQTGRLAKLEELESRLKGGDVAEGRKLFFGKALCSTCHAVVGNGGTFGPDLTNIGEIRSQHDILEAIVFPSASFAREYETMKVTTGSVSHEGIIRNELANTVTVQTGPGVSIHVLRTDISSMAPQNVSLMPAGLHEQLSTGELANLMAYLTTLPDGMGHLNHARP